MENPYYTKEFFMQEFRKFVEDKYGKQDKEWKFVFFMDFAQALLTSCLIKAKPAERARIVDTFLTAVDVNIKANEKPHLRIVQ